MDLQLKRLFSKGALYGLAGLGGLFVVLLINVYVTDWRDVAIWNVHVSYPSEAF